MKKNISYYIAALSTAALLSACAFTSAQAAESGDPFQIVTTIFPEYDWVTNILGENPAGAEVTMLLDNGVDLHSYQPTAIDILNISTCDLFIYVGGESDDWVDDALQEAVNKDMIVLNLLDVLGDSVKAEEMVDGMQETEHDHGDDDDHDADEHDEDEHDADEHEHEHEHDEDDIEYDEHVWLSLRNAAALVGKISDAIAQIDQENADLYQANASAYIEKLNALDAEYQAAVDAASYHTLLFADRFPFRYLTDDYGLEYYAAFAGCSAETEASFETITFLSQKTDELSLPVVMTIEGTSHRIAETVVQNTQTKDQQILTMDSIQSTTLKDVQNGASYLSIMEHNLDVLKEALK